MRLMNITKFNSILEPLTNGSQEPSQRNIALIATNHGTHLYGATEPGKALQPCQSVSWLTRGVQQEERPLDYSSASIDLFPKTGNIRFTRNDQYLDLLLNEWHFRQFTATLAHDGLKATIVRRKRTTDGKWSDPETVILDYATPETALREVMPPSEDTSSTQSIGE